MPRTTPRTTTSRLSPRARRWPLAAALLALAACGGARTPTGPPLLPTRTLPAVVELPAGVAVRPEALTALSALGEAKVSAVGAASLLAFDLGPQLAMALSPKGTPMLMGWLDGGRRTLSARTTAEVLVYFAAGMAQLPLEARRRAHELIPSLPGLSSLEAAIAEELRRDPDAHAAPTPRVREALDALVRPMFRGASGRAAPQGVRVEPGDEQSGVRVNIGDLNTVFLTNTTRRRAQVFVERVSYTTPDGAVTPDPAGVASLELPPVVGLSGGVFGALTDMVNAYYGNQATAYGPVDTAPVTLAARSGATKTSYRVTVVGPGLSAGTEGSLTPTQAAALAEVSLRGFTKDALFPFLVNLALGSGLVDYTSGQDTLTAKFLADLAASITLDLVNLAPQVPGLIDQVKAGAWQDALLTLWTNAAASNALRTALVDAFDRYKTFYYLTPDNVISDKFKNFATAFSKFNVAVNLAGGFLQSFDSGMYGRALRLANRADRWAADAVELRVRLSPAEAEVAENGTVALTASVPDATDTVGFTYRWTNTGRRGVLREVGGSGREANDYCSSSNKATYAQRGSGTDPDTVGVEAYPRPRCEGEPLGSATAAMKAGGAGHLLSGSPDGKGSFGVDDGLDVYLNGRQVYTDGNRLSGLRPPIPLPGAKQGDTLRFVVRDTFGHCAGMEKVYLTRGARSAVADPGFNLGCGRGAGDKGVVHDVTFTVPF